MLTFVKRIGLDLGSRTSRVYVRGEGIVVSEPSLIAFDKLHSRSLAIADYAAIEVVLHDLITRVQGRQRLFKPDVMLSIPSAVTSDERRTVTKAAVSAGAKQVWLIDEPIAAAMGARLPIRESRATAICDLGAGKTEIAVISLSGVVVADCSPAGGDALDAAIVDEIGRRHGLLVEQEVAEEVKVSIGNALPLSPERVMEVRGRDLVSGLQRTMEVGSNELAEAMSEPLDAIARLIRGVLAQAPPGLAADILEAGLVLSGGGALLGGLDRYLSEKTGLPVVVAADPQNCVVRGTGHALEQFEVLKRNQLHVR